MNTPTNPVDDEKRFRIDKALFERNIHHLDKAKNERLIDFVLSLATPTPQLDAEGFTHEQMQKILTWHNAVLNKATERTAKAYGGCTNCYGKGYASVNDRWVGHDTDTDIGSPGGYVSGGGSNAMKFCTCERGRELGKRFREATERAEVEGAAKQTQRIRELVGYEEEPDYDPGDATYGDTEHDHNAVVYGRNEAKGEVQGKIENELGRLRTLTTPEGDSKS